MENKTILEYLEHLKANKIINFYTLHEEIYFTDIGEEKQEKICINTTPFETEKECELIKEILVNVFDYDEHNVSFEFSCEYVDNFVYAIDQITYSTEEVKAQEKKKIEKLKRIEIIQDYKAENKQIPHRLKIESEDFKAFLRGKKLFEICKNDRDFKVGDKVELREISVLDGVQKFTGDGLIGKIKYTTDYEQKEGYIVLGFNKFKRFSINASLFNL